MGRRGPLYNAYYECLNRSPILNLTYDGVQGCNLSPEFTVSGVGNVRLDPPEPVVSNTNGYIYTLSEPGLMLKLVKVRHAFELGLLCMEKSLSALLDGLDDQVIRTFDVVDGLSPQCALASYVMERGVGAVDKLGLTRHEAMAVLGRALTILQNLHKRGVVHRDTHFGNFILLNRTDVVGSLRLIDFGLARPILNEKDPAVDFRMLADESGKLFGVKGIFGRFSASVQQDPSPANINAWIRRFSRPTPTLVN